MRETHAHIYVAHDLYAVALLLLVLCRSTVSAEYSYEFRSPYSRGVVLYAPAGNMTNLTMGEGPSQALRLFTLTSTAGNDELIIPNPITLLTGEISAGNWVAHLLLESFKLHGLSPEEVSNRLSDRLHDGLNFRATMEIPMLAIGRQNLHAPYNHGWGMDFSIVSGGMFFVPGEIFDIIFAPAKSFEPGKQVTFDKMILQLELMAALHTAYSRKMDIDFPFVKRFNFDFSWGIGLTYYTGHAMYLIQLSDGVIDYRDDNVLNMKGRGKIVAAGLGVSDEYPFGHMFANGFAPSGIGFGFGTGFTLKNEKLSLSLYIRDAGQITWSGDVHQAGLDIEGDSVYILDFFGDDSPLVVDRGGFKKIDSYKLPLETRFVFETSRVWRAKSRSPMIQNLSTYRIVSLGYRQPIIKKFGKQKDPTLCLGLENGFRYGKVPVRVAWTIGGWDGTSSSVELALIEKELTYTISYRSIGDPLFRLRKGFELAFTAHVYWNPRPPKPGRTSYFRKIFLLDD